MIFKIYKMCHAALVFLAIFAKICYKDVEHPEATKWLVKIPQGIETAKEIALQEGFTITNEVPDLQVYRFSPIHSTEGKQVEEILEKFSKHQEISWSKPLTTIHHQSSIFGMPESGDGSEDFNPFGAMFGGSPSDEDSTSDMSSGRQRRFSQGSKLESIHDHPELKKYPDVLCVGPEMYIVKTDKPQLFNDPLYGQQYFLRSCDELQEPIPSPYDIKLVQTWQDFGVYGKGVKVLVLDDGTKIDHEDLDISLEYSYNFFTKRNDPTPSAGETHGTFVAGTIGMKRNNGLCGVGIAPEATIGAVKMQLNHKMTPDIKAAAFLHKYKEVDIIITAVVESTVFDPNEKMTYDAMEKGGTEGRGGKGILYVISAGNQKNEQNAVQCSRVVSLNNIHVITIGGVSPDGSVSPYSNRCANVMAVLYSGDAYPYSIPTIAPGPSNRECKKDYGGTSASAPMAAGALALVLEANPELSWRDVHYIVAWTSEISPLTKNTQWIKNGGGFYVSLDFGFGLMNIYDMVELAKNFPKTSPPMNTCRVNPTVNVQNAQLKADARIRIPFRTNGCKGTNDEINFVEHVLLLVDLEYRTRGHLQIHLTSAKNTRVALLEPRPYDANQGDQISNFHMHSIHTWGENPEGEWKVDIFDESGRNNSGLIRKMELIIFGTKDQPELYKKGPRKYFPFKLNRS